MESKVEVIIDGKSIGWKKESSARFMGRFLEDQGFKLLDVPELRQMFYFSV